MPSTNKSPYATSFKSAIKKGTPAGTAVNAIAKRTGKPLSTIFNSLHKADLCHRQKLNGQWIYWAVEGKKGTVANAKASQLQMWQSFVDWCIVSGQCKPQQLEKYVGSQQNFMAYCRKFFNRQLSGTSTTGTKRKTTKRRSTTTARSRKTTSYKFPRTTTRRYRRAA